MLAAAAVAVILISGAVACLAALPAGAAAFPARLAGVFGLGYATVMWCSTLLVLVHLMRPAPLAALLIATVAALGLVALRTTPPRALLRGLRGELHDGWPLVLAGLAAVAAVALARLHIPVDPSAGGWRYWSDGLEVADAGHVPSAVLQWGSLHAPAISKLGANAYSAALAFGLRDHAFSAMGASLWLSATGFAAGLFALGWELGLRFTAALLPLLALSGHAWPGGLVVGVDIVHKLQFFQTEDSGRMCMLAALVLAIPLLRDAPRPAGRIVAVTALIGAAALTHLVAVIGIGALLAGYAAVAAAGSGRARSVAGRAVLVAGGGVAVALLCLALVGGDLGFQGASGARYQLVDGRYDPTAALMGRHATPIAKSQRRFYTPPVTAARNLYRSATSLPASGAGLAVPVAMLLALAACAIALGTRAERQAVAAAAIALALLYAVELLFSARYTLYIPATFGDRRVFEYAAIPLLIVAAAGLNTLVAHSRRLQPRLPLAFAAALPAVVAVAIGTDGLSGGVHGGTPSSSMITAARLATPCDARLLTPTRTRGSFQALTGRASMQEGLMVFLRPPLLNQALGIERAARRFYADPAANAGLLDRWSIDAVLARPPASAKLARLPQLQLVRRVGQVSVFSTVGTPGGDAPRPSDVPGYRCVRGQLG